MVEVPFFIGFSHSGAPSRLHARNGRINFSKFLYVRDFPEYPYSIAQIQANTVSLIRSRKTYSRYLKKIRPSENLALLRPTQYPLVFMDRTVLAIGLLKSGIGPVPRLQDT